MATAKPKLSPAEMLFLSDVRQAGADGVIWSRRNAVVASRLL
jgi:hypothetical protein